LAKDCVVSVTKRLTLQNYQSEIGAALQNIIRYRIEKLGPQFATFKDNNARDAHREKIVRLFICASRARKISNVVW
jgi:hypothetical protein